MAKCLSQSSEVMPTVANGVILQYELRCHRGTEAERKRRGAIQLIVTEGTYRVGCLFAVFSQQLDGLRLTGICVFGCVPGVDFGNYFPCDIGDAFAGSNCLRNAHFNWINAGNVIDDYACRTPPPAALHHRRRPL
jgi:hypothetical protein